jgi:hypothetical protein
VLQTAVHACSYLGSASTSGQYIVPNSALQPPADTRKAVYVVYTRASSFPALLHSLQTYYGQHTTKDLNTYVWLDVLCLPQCPPQPTHLVLQHINPLLRSMSVIVVLDESAELLCRAWCLYEIAIAAWATRPSSRRWLHIVPNAFQGDELCLIDAIFSASFAEAKATGAEDVAALGASLQREMPPLEPAHVGSLVADTLWVGLSQQMLRAAAAATKNDAASLHAVQVRPLATICVGTVFHFQVHAL